LDDVCEEHDNEAKGDNPIVYRGSTLKHGVDTDEVTQGANSVVEVILEREVDLGVVKEAVDLNEADNHHNSCEDEVDVALAHQLEVNLEQLPLECLLEGLTLVLSLLVLVLLRVQGLIHFSKSIVLMQIRCLVGFRIMAIANFVLLIIIKLHL
jgi:hypothetical protein